MIYKDWKFSDGITNYSEKNIVKKQPTQKPRKNVDIQVLNIGTWNLCSLYRTRTLTTVVYELDIYGLAILAIQEIRNWDLAIIIV